MARPPDPRTARLVEAYARQTAALRARVAAVIAGTWAGLPDYRDADIDRFVTQVVPVVAGAQRTMASITDGYLAVLDHVARGSDPIPVGVPTAVITEEALRGIAAADVYRRPGFETWTALADGLPFTEAVARGARRAEVLALTDLQLAKTHATRHVLETRDGIAGYRRVLTGSHSCGLCIVASTQRYRRGDLLPIHPGCDCSVVPIWGDHDPGQIIDPERLAGVHDAIAERFGVSDAGARGPVDYRTALVTHEHGELGPILGVRGQQFTGPGDI